MAHSKSINITVLIFTTFLLYGCAIGAIDFTDNRKIKIIHDGNRSEYELSGDIEIIDRDYFLELIEKVNKR